MLVIYLTPDGNNDDQVKYMHKRATAWATSIILEGVQQNKARKALNYTIPQTMRYHLPAMTLNTGSSPRCPLQYHSLVFIENHSFIIGIEPFRNTELEFIYRSDCFDRTYVYS